jgi:hypothetical protein
MMMSLFETDSTIRVEEFGVSRIPGRANNNLPVTTRFGTRLVQIDKDLRVSESTTTCVKILK